MSKEIDPLWLGPAMSALSPRRRLFVLAMASDPFGSRAEWAKAAGYSDVKEAARVRAHYIWHDPKVQAAIQEVARATLGSMGPLIAVHGILEAARDPKRRDHIKALEMIANRVGMSETQKIEVVHRDLTGDALMERIQMLAAKHGLDTRKLLGTERLIEGTAKEIPDDRTHARAVEAGGDEDKLEPT